jgi:hypothetical protein
MTCAPDGPRVSISIGASNTSAADNGQSWLRRQCHFDLVVSSIRARLRYFEKCSNAEIFCHDKSDLGEMLDRRFLMLQPEVTDCDERLRRLYLSIENGIVALDDIFRERTAPLKS